MSYADANASNDLIRWTFALPEEAVEAVEEHLTDLGADVFVRNRRFHVTWEEPELDLDAVVEALWSIVGKPFEITQEEFHRLALHILQFEADEVSAEPAGEFHPGFDSLEIKDL